jgi:hypothetical protein
VVHYIKTELCTKPGENGGRMRGRQELRWCDELRGGHCMGWVQKLGNKCAVKTEVVEAHCGGQLPLRNVETMVKGGDGGRRRSSRRSSSSSSSLLLTLFNKSLLRLRFHKQPSKTVMLYSRLMFLNFKQFLLILFSMDCKCRVFLVFPWIILLLHTRMFCCHNTNFKYFITE